MTCSVVISMMALIEAWLFQWRLKELLQTIGELSPWLLRLF